MSKELLKKDRRITAAQAVKMLKEDGREVTEKEAEEIFRDFLTDILCKQFARILHFTQIFNSNSES